ncbi:MAG TPA: hypothetical protein VFI03_10780 [Solirubrobacterales bacterium]|nr:hypothetical protein [Solirubrobacterales bacterium]
MTGRGMIALSLAALAACALAVGFSVASFTDTSQNPQTISAVADFLAPSAGTSVVAKSEGGAAGYVRAGGNYRVYAAVTDSGNPSSKTSSVKANLSALTAAQTAATLSSGSYTVDGVSYNYRSAQLKVDSGVSAGTKAYALTLADGAGNSRVQNFAAIVDNGPFAGSAFATANGSGNNSGEPEQGDTVTFTYNEAPEPESLRSSWDGEAESVKVSISDSSGNETLTVGSTDLGSVALKGDYVDSGKTVSFSSSSMVLSGNSVVITLSSPSSSSNVNDDSGNRAPVWSPSSSVYDRAGNACSTSTVPGANARQF